MIITSDSQCFFIYTIFHQQKEGSLYDYTFILGAYTSFMKPATEASWKQHCHPPKLPMFWFETQVTPQAQRCGFHVSMSHILHSQCGEQNIDADFQMDNTNLIHGYGPQTLPADTHSPWDFWMPERHLSCGQSCSFWTPMLPNPNPNLNLNRKIKSEGYWIVSIKWMCNVQILRLFLFWEEAQHNNVDLTSIVTHIHVEKAIFDRAMVHDTSVR
jgi:hypothetical protein